MGDLYEGAVRLLHDDPMPGRVRFVAHAVREICNRLPDYLSGQQVRKRVEYVNRLDTIADQWSKHKSSIVTFSPDLPPGQASPPETAIPRKLYNDLDKLVTDHMSARERPLDSARRLYEGLNPENNGKMGQTLRPVLLQWVETTKWFIELVHDTSKGKRDSDYDWAEINHKFELVELSLRSIVGAFFRSVRELDEVLDETNA